MNLRLFDLIQKQLSKFQCLRRSSLSDFKYLFLWPLPSISICQPQASLWSISSKSGWNFKSEFSFFVGFSIHLVKHIVKLQPFEPQKSKPAARVRQFFAMNSHMQDALQQTKLHWGQKAAITTFSTGIFFLGIDRAIPQFHSFFINLFSCQGLWGLISACAIGFIYCNDSDLYHIYYRIA